MIYLHIEVATVNIIDVHIFRLHYMHAKLDKFIVSVVSDDR